MLEFECLKQNELFSIIKRTATSGDTVKVLVHNVRALQDMQMGDNRIINNDIIGFTEKQTRSSDSTCKIIETLNLFNINFDNNEKRFLSLANECRNDVPV